MACVFRREAFAEKNVSQVPAAIVADNLDSLTIGVLMSINGAGDFVVEARPATAAFELILGAVQRGVTTTANERASLLPIRVLTGKWTLRPLIKDNMSLFGG